MKRYKSTGIYKDLLEAKDGKWVRYKDVSNTIQALKILDKISPLRNDFDAYLLDVVGWGLGLNKKPDPEHFGLPKAGE